MAIFQNKADEEVVTANRNKNKEEGAVLALVAISLVAIVAFFTFVIDLNMMANSKEQVGHFARFAALAAIEEYYNPNVRCNGNTPIRKGDDGYDQASACPPCVRYKMAIDKVNEISGFNRIVSYNPAKESQHKPKVIPELGQDLETTNCGVPSSSNRVARLVAGFMFDDKVQENDADKYCKNHGLRSPCFVKLTNPEIGTGQKLTNDPNSPAPTAFVVEGEYYRNTTGLWSNRIFGRDAVDLTGEAVATLTPRRGCFVVDISSSSVRNTHIKRAVSKGSFENWLAGSGSATNAGLPRPGSTDPVGNEFSYYLTCDQSDSYNQNFSNPESPAFNPYYNPVIGNCRYHSASELVSLTELPFNTPFFWASNDRAWENLQMAFPTRPTSVPNPLTQHYAEDYVLKYTYGDKDYDSRLHDLHPNPHSNNSFSIDKASIDGVGNWVHLDVAFLKGTAPAEYKGPEPLRSIFEGLKSALDMFANRRVGGDQACLIFYDRYLSWTRVFNLSSEFDRMRAAIDFDQVGNSFSLTSPDPIGYADPNVRSVPNPSPGFEMIVRHGLFPRWQRASKTNIVPAISEAYRQLAETPRQVATETIDFIVHIGDGLVNCRAGDDCQNVYNYYVQGMNLLKSTIRDNLQDDNVPIHVVLVGQDVAPHSYDVPDPDGEGCLSQNEIRTSGYPMVKGNPPGTNLASVWNNAGITNPFYQANVDWYEIALMTRGLWLPIRPLEYDGDTCDGTPITDEDGDLCDSRHFITLGGDSARRRTDPWCRTPAEQLTDYMADIMGDNPYRLVDPDARE